MYSNILVAIEHSDADQAVLTHIEQLARLTGARLLLVHVADGWAARHFDDLKLRESEEIKDDRAYLERLCTELVSRGFDTRARLALGDPASELVKVAAQEQRRPDRDVHARPSLPERPPSRQHRRSGPPSGDGAGADGESRDDVRKRERAATPRGWHWPLGRQTAARLPCSRRKPGTCARRQKTAGFRSGVPSTAASSSPVPVPGTSTTL